MNAINKIFSTIFPPGYRFFSIYIITIFSTDYVSDFYSSSFFTISLITTFSGVAIATQSYVEGRNLSLITKTYLVIFLTIIPSLLIFILWDYSFFSYLIIILTSIFYSMYEVFRADIKYNGKFMQLTISSLVSVGLFIIIYIFFKNNKEAITLLSFFSLLLPIAFLNSKVKCEKVVFCKKIFKDIISHSASNGLSTGVSFLFPLLLSRELSDGSTSTMAQIFTLSMILFFYPRFLSTRFLSKCSSLNYHEFCKKVSGYILGAALISLFIFVFLLDLEWYGLFLMWGLLASQLSLPMSNLLMMNGEGKIQLVNNTYSLLFLLCLLFSSNGILTSSLDKPLLMSISFFLYQIFRFYRLSLVVRNIFPKYI